MKLFASLLVLISVAGCSDSPPPPSLWELLPECDSKAPDHYEYKLDWDDEVEQVVQMLRSKNWSNITVDEKDDWTEVEADCVLV
jgi:hypothetical protein